MRKSFSLKIYSSLIAVLFVVAYVALFTLFASTPYSGQEIFFLVLIPIIIAIDWIVLFILASMRSADSVIASGVAAFAVCGCYSALAVIVAAILALLRTTLRVQITIQFVLFAFLLIGIALSMFTASQVKSVNRTTDKLLGDMQEVKDAFRRTVDVMQAKGLKGEDLESLSEMMASYMHLAPCRDPKAQAVDMEIKAALETLEGLDPSSCDSAISKLRFLIKRRMSYTS